MCQMAIFEKTAGHEWAPLPVMRRLGRDYRQRVYAQPTTTPALAPKPSSTVKNSTDYRTGHFQRPIRSVTGDGPHGRNTLFRTLMYLGGARQSYVAHARSTTQYHNRARGQLIPFRRSSSKNSLCAAFECALVNGPRPKALYTSVFVRRTKLVTYVCILSRVLRQNKLVVVRQSKLELVQ